MADRLGSEFQFDTSGRLTGMYLTEDYAVEYEYERLTAPRGAFATAPCRLVPEGPARTQVDGFSLPSRLRSPPAPASNSPTP